jgi:hypothetical protein
MPNPRLLEFAEKWKNPEVPKERTLERKKEKPSLENVLVFSSKKEIFVIDNGQNSIPIEFASRDDFVSALCSHEGKLYDGGNYNKIFETISNKEVASRSGWIRALCSHPRKYFVDAGVLK